MEEEKEIGEPHGGADIIENMARPVAKNLEQRQLFPGSHLETVSKTCNMAESGAATADSPCIYLETTVCLNHAARIEVEELMG